MKALLIATCVVTLCLAFLTHGLMGAGQKKKPQGKQNGAVNAKGKNSQKQKDKTGRATGQATANNKILARQLAYRIASSKVPKGARISDTNYSSGSAPKGSYSESCSLRWVLGQQQTNQQEQQRKQLAEQRRKQAEAEAARRKKLETDRKERIGSKTAAAKKEIAADAAAISSLENRFQKLKGKRKKLEADRKERIGSKTAAARKGIEASAASLSGLENRLQKLKGKRNKLGDAIGLVLAKSEGENVAGVKARLDRMKSELPSYANGSTALAGELSEIKAACAKWKSSGSSSGKGGGSSSALAKVEEEALRINRGFSRVEYELKKAEAYCEDSTKALFFCVSELVRAGVSFSTSEKETIRSLSN